MANEITFNASWRVAKSLYDSGTLRLPMSTFDQTTAGGGGPVYQAIGTTYEAVSFGDNAPGIVVAYNLDATNYVELGLEVSATFYPFGLLKANRGSFAILWKASGVTWYARANTSACNICIQGWNA